MTTLDGVIQEVGVCGPFQGLLVLATYSTIVVSASGMMLMAFGSYNPGWTCLDDVAVGGNASSLTGLSTPTPSNSTDRCTQYKGCQNVSFLPGTSTVVSEWGLVCDHKWTPSLIFTVQMVGVMLGAYLAGHLGDCAGRKASLYSMVALHGVANLVAVFSPSWEIFAAVRFFVGIGIGGMLTTSYIIPLEFMGQFWRGFVGSLPTWNIGAALFSVAVILLKDWRHLHLLNAAFSGLVFLAVFWVPESFRWLAVHSRDVKAGAVVTKIAKVNKRPLPNLELVTAIAESERRKALAENSERYTYLDLFRDTTLRKGTIVMGVVWASMATVYYGISFGVQSLSGDFYINFLILSLMELPAFLFVLPALSFLSRRWASSLHFCFVSAACFAVTAIALFLRCDGCDQATDDGNALKERLIMSLTVLAKVGTIGAWNVISLYCGELFPTAVRNLSSGYLNASARIGSMLGPVLFPKDPALLYLAMAGMGVIMAVCAWIVWLLPETKGAPLEDTIRSKKHLDLGLPRGESVSVDDAGGEALQPVLETNGTNKALIKDQYV
ncbi:solute carrier family 22 member 4 [Elysia marginata]|uniref:Solute carrier family 22 member 4 n=1 Tax=Elysia marginata TaxID=1093978 RepID=A0AAV4F4Y9_9GAST|nr:solute carrier family 22 member 4 [Elysia marginata]